jgi:hypothetical protein
MLLLPPPLRERQEELAPVQPAAGPVEAGRRNNFSPVVPLCKNQTGRRSTPEAAPFSPRRRQQQHRTAEACFFLVRVFQSLFTSELGCFFACRCFCVTRRVACGDEANCLQSTPPSATWPSGSRCARTGSWPSRRSPSPKRSTWMRPRPDLPATPPSKQ